MFATIKSLIPEPRQADQPRRYVGRHRLPEPVVPDIPVSPAPIAGTPAPTPAPSPAQDETDPETAAA
jgi:hypothetical protein